MRAGGVPWVDPDDPMPREPGVVGRIPPVALLDLSRLATLREVARLGSYSAAAESLCFTPSAVSQQMAGLSRDLGAVLFERTPRGMRLTPCAELLVAHVEGVFARLNAAQGELEAVAGGVRGRMRVGSFPTATAAFTAAAMGAFEERFSFVDLSLIDGEPWESVARLKERELDLAVVFDFPGWALSADIHGRIVCRDEEIACANLFDDPFVVVLAGDHPLAAQDLVELDDLAGERIVAGPPGCSPWGGDFRQLCRAAGFEPELDTRYSTLEFASLQAVVATGGGVTLVPGLALASLPDVAGVVTRPLAGGPIRHVRVATLAGVTASPAGEAMAAAARGGGGRAPRRAGARGRGLTAGLRAQPRSSTAQSAWTLRGQNCVPALSRSSASACSRGSRPRYGRSEVIASHASQAKTMRLAIGMSSPASPCG
jgi:DNA-binding transcriptional LysR family regulator